MIHFLGKVFLEYTETKPQLDHMTVKPSQYIRIVDRGLANIMDSLSINKHIANFKDVEECLEKFVTFDNFISFLNEKEKEERVIIYCDEVSMPKLLCSLWKSIFPGITKEIAYSFYVSYKDNEYFRRDDRNEYIEIDINSAKIEKTAFLTRYWDLDRELFYSYFDNAESFSLENKETAIGLEFAFTKLLLDNERFKPVFSEKLEYLYKKNISKEIIFMISTIREHCLILLRKKGIMNEIMLNDTSVIDYLKGQERYNILFDGNVKHAPETYDYLRSKGNILKLISDLTFDCSVIHKEINPSFVSFEEFKQENPICSYILEQKKEPILEDLMDANILKFSNYHFIRSYVQTGIFNYFLLQSICITNEANPSALDALKV